VEPLADVFRHNQTDLRGLAALAARIISILEQPQLADGDALDLYCLSRLLGRRGEGPAARSLYERALSCGLPEAIDRVARGELALLAKRQRDYARATSLWKELLGEDIDGLDAYEQLAIYYEHRASRPERAAAVTREALEVLQTALRQGRLPAEDHGRWQERLTYRLSRLSRKERVRSVRDFSEALD
jgi:tetratricopeptide (TPR) repeat protein